MVIHYKTLRKWCLFLHEKDGPATATISVITTSLTISPVKYLHDAPHQHVLGEIWLQPPIKLSKARFTPPFRCPVTDNNPDISTIPVFTVFSVTHTPRDKLTFRSCYFPKGMNEAVAIAQQHGLSICLNHRLVSDAFDPFCQSVESFFIKADYLFSVLSRHFSLHMFYEAPVVFSTPQMLGLNRYLATSAGLDCPTENCTQRTSPINSTRLLPCYSFRYKRIYLQIATIAHQPFWTKSKPNARS